MAPEGARNSSCLIASLGHHDKNPGKTLAQISMPRIAPVKWNGTFLFVKLYTWVCFLADFSFFGLGLTNEKTRPAWPFWGADTKISRLIQVLIQVLVFWSLYLLIVFFSFVSWQVQTYQQKEPSPDIFQAFFSDDTLPHWLSTLPERQRFQSVSFACWAKGLGC